MRDFRDQVFKKILQVSAFAGGLFTIWNVLPHTTELDTWKFEADGIPIHKNGRKFTPEEIQEAVAKQRRRRR